MKNPLGTGVAVNPRAQTSPRPERRRRLWSPWVGWPLGMWTGGLHMLDAWLQVCEHLWGTRPLPRVRGNGAAVPDGQRRVEDVPWVPQLEATVIPLRRHTDPPGAEATRLSMRLAIPTMPWGESSANVISFEAIINARSHGDEHDDGEHPRPPSGNHR